MKHGDIISFRFVDGGDCKDCVFYDCNCDDYNLIGARGIFNCTGGHIVKVETPEIEKPPFDTRLGQLTDEDAMRGNPKCGRVWVYVYTDAPIEQHLYVVANGMALLSHAGWRDIRTVCLVRPDELTAAGIDPREAGVKE